MKKCTLGSRHKWEHIKNVQIHTQTARTVSISLKGLYKCACGAKKYGFMQKGVEDFRNEYPVQQMQF